MLGAGRQILFTEPTTHSGLLFVHTSSLGLADTASRCPREEGGAQTQSWGCHLWNSPPPFCPFLPHCGGACRCSVPSELPLPPPHIPGRRPHLTSAPSELGPLQAELPGRTAPFSNSRVFSLGRPSRGDPGTFSRHCSWARSSFSQHVFTEDLLCTRFCSRCWTCRDEPRDKNICLVGSRPDGHTARCWGASSITHSPTSAPEL